MLIGRLSIYGANMAENVFTWSSCPLEFSHLLLGDAMGPMYPRGG